MVSEASAIPARSHHQAFDWSLALLSQGIESTVDRDPENGRWLLIVDSRDLTFSIQILRKYVAENRKLPRVEPPATSLIFEWGNSWFFALLAALFVWQLYDPIVQTLGAMNSSAFLAGQWWRPFTAVLLHADLAHLAANATIGMVFLGLAGAIFGARSAFLISYAAGVIANLAHCLLPSNHSSLGASGMIMGALGAMTANTILQRNSRSLTFFAALRAGGAGLLLLVLLGFDPHPQTDVFAHVIGFFAGFTLGVATLLRKSRAVISPHHPTPRAPISV